MLKDKFNAVRKYAAIYATGGVAALQSLKMEIFSFPPVVHIYLGYFFSIITVCCIFLGCSNVYEWGKNIPLLLKKMKEIEDQKKIEP